MPATSAALPPSVSPATAPYPTAPPHDPPDITKTGCPACACACAPTCLFTRLDRV